MNIATAPTVKLRVALYCTVRFSNLSWVGCAGSARVEICSPSDLNAAVRLASCYCWALRDAMQRRVGGHDCVMASWLHLLLSGRIRYPPRLASSALPERESAAAGTNRSNYPLQRQTLESQLSDAQAALTQARGDRQRLLLEVRKHDPTFTLWPPGERWGDASGWMSETSLTR